jgi:predicted ester cyclase
MSLCFDISTSRSWITEGENGRDTHLDFNAFPDFRAEALSTHHGDDIVYVDTRITGTHHGPWAGVPASGRSIDVRCGCIFHFDGARLVKETVFFDHAKLLGQSARERSEARAEGC